MQKIELERIAGQLDSEVSLLKSDMPPGTGEKVVTKIQKISKRFAEDLDKLLVEKCPPWYVENF